MTITAAGKAAVTELMFWLVMLKPTPHFTTELSSGNEISPSTWDVVMSAEENCLFWTAAASDLAYFFNQASLLLEKRVSLSVDRQWAKPLGAT